MCFCIALLLLVGPKYGRPCTCLAWHPTDSHLVGLNDNVLRMLHVIASLILQLAQGLEKWRAGSSIIVWDVTRASSDRPRPHSSLSSAQDFSSSSDDTSARVFDVGSAEGTSSLAWIPSQPTCLVAGIGSRYLRIYDIRGKVTSLVECLWFQFLSTYLFYFQRQRQHTPGTSLWRITRRFMVYV